MFLGIEIGGTKLQLGIGPGDGTIHALWRDVIVPTDGAEGIRRQIVRAVPELLAKAGHTRAQLKAVGVGFGGPVDDVKRIVIKSHQIAGWDNFPLADWISDLVGLPALLGNDADVAGLGEALFGAGAGLSPIFYITIGSGIGGGLIINGEIYRGCGRGAAEIGHLRLLSESGDYRILEHLASGWAISTNARGIVADNLQQCDRPLVRLIDGNIDNLTTQRISEAIREGDSWASSLLEAPLRYLAEGICQVIALLCPRRIVIGGGVSLMGEEALFEPLRRLVAERVFRPFSDSYDIVPAALGEEVVVHGALALCAKFPSPSGRGARGEGR